MSDRKTRVGFALTGSFCTFAKAFDVIEQMSKMEIDITPIMSEISYSTDTRFGKAADFASRLFELTGREVIKSVKEAEPIGPNALLDILVVAPCTGNTIGKLAGGITDSSVTMAAKAHLRNNRPLLIAVSTNDALSTSAKNIGVLMGNKNVFFVPMQQDDPQNKSNSMVADFSKLIPAMEEALKGKQLQPVYF